MTVKRFRLWRIEEAVMRKCQAYGCKEEIMNQEEEVMNNRPKVFGIGLSRTGTTSLTEALTLLGYKSLHWPHDMRTQRELLDFYAASSSVFKLSVAEEYDAITDTPIASVYRELDGAYPDSRFVLTVRERSSWLKSCDKFWQRPGHVGAVDSDYRRYCHSVRGRLYGGADFDAVRFAHSYDAHVNGVLSWFSAAPERLLVIDICAGDGWALLCPFLHSPIPVCLFPQRNRAIHE